MEQTDTFWGNEGHHQLSSQLLSEAVSSPKEGEDQNGERCRRCLCVLCCYSYTPKPTPFLLPGGVLEEGQGYKDTPRNQSNAEAKGATFGKFFKDIANEMGVPLKNLGHLAESSGAGPVSSKSSGLSVCPDCLSLIEAAMVVKEQVDSVQGHVLSLQLQILRQLRELEGLVSKYQEEMRRIESVVKNADVSCLEMQVRREQTSGESNCNREEGKEVAAMYNFQAVSDSNSREEFGRNVFLLRRGILQVCTSDMSVKNICATSRKDDHREDDDNIYDPLLNIKTELDDSPEGDGNCPLGDDDIGLEIHSVTKEEHPNPTALMRRSKRLRKGTIRTPATPKTSGPGRGLSTKQVQPRNESNPDIGESSDPKGPSQRKKLKRVTPKVKPTNVGRSRRTLPRGKNRDVYRALKRQLSPREPPPGVTKRFRGLYGWEGVKKDHIIFKCVTCQNFETVGRGKELIFEHHLRQHETENKQFSCELCPASFTHHQFCEFHRLSHYGFYKHFCDVCSSCVPMPDFLSHLKAHKEVPEEQLIYCPNCSFVCTKRTSYISHLKKHKVNLNSKTPFLDLAVTPTAVQFRCDLCSLQFTWNKGLLAHYKEAHHVEEEYPCEEVGCGKKFIRAVDLYRHKTRLHKEQRLYKCDHCGKCLKSVNALQEHSRLHTGEKPFRCREPSCSERFLRKISLDAHCMRAHGAEKYKCNRCDKEYTERTQLKRHMNLHDQKGHHCDHCGKILSSATLLKIHLRSHSDEKHWTCEECGKSFKQPHSFKHHMNMHAGKKDWKCTYCEKAFTRKEFLTCHLRTHTGERPYVCDVCGKDFNQKSALMVHKKKQHKENPSGPVVLGVKSFSAAITANFEGAGTIGEGIVEDRAGSAYPAVPMAIQPQGEPNDNTEIFSM